MPAAVKYFFQCRAGHLGTNRMVRRIKSSTNCSYASSHIQLPVGIFLHYLYRYNSTSYVEHTIIAIILKKSSGINRYNNIPTYDL